MARNNSQVLKMKHVSLCCPHNRLRPQLPIEISGSTEIACWEIGDRQERRKEALPLGDLAMIRIINTHFMAVKRTNLGVLFPASPSFVIDNNPPCTTHDLVARFVLKYLSPNSFTPIFTPLDLIVSP